MKISARQWTSLLVVSALVVAGLGVLSMKRPGPGAATAPYDHEGLSEVSAATEKIVDGEARVMAGGLEARGYWCVQPRSNDRTAQVTCLSPGRDVRVDLMAARDGRVLYADVDLGPAPTTPGRRPEPSDRLRRVLDASLLKVWPQDRTTVQDLLDSAVPREFMPLGDPGGPSDPQDQFDTHEARTDTASWSLWSFYTGEPLALRARTADLRDRSWPFDGRHYATSLSAATAELTADGFTCATACHRAADGQTVVFDTHDGQIVTAELTVRSRVDGGRAADSSGAWVREGLPFLTPAVRAAVGRRIETSRLEEESWRGVIAGTPLAITAEPGGSLTPDGHPASDLTVAIGIALPDAD